MPHDGGKTLNRRCAAANLCILAGEEDLAYLHFTYGVSHLGAVKSAWFVFSRPAVNDSALESSVP